MPGAAAQGANAATGAKRRRVPSTRSTPTSQLLTKAIVSLPPDTLSLPYSQLWRALSDRMLRLGVKAGQSPSHVDLARRRLSHRASSLSVPKPPSSVTVATVRVSCDMVPLDRWPKEASRVHAMVRGWVCVIVCVTVCASVRVCVQV